MIRRLFANGDHAALACACLLLAQPAHAYIDPGTGSALLYVVSGIVLSVYFGIRGLYYRVVDLFFRARFRDHNCEIAIHCEDPRYEITFLPIINVLQSRGLDVTLFTMYERDGTFPLLPEGVVHRAIPPGMVGYAYLNNLEAKLLVTTTPQLDVMTFRRSRQVRHYAIVSHALGESRYVRPFAYDYFDSVLCCGPILKANVRKMEGIRKLPAKQLLETGIPHWEELMRRARESSQLGPEPVVLVAPSWGPLSMFEAFGTGFVAQIAQRYQVIVRPHPQMKVSQPELYKQILALDGVTIDTARTPSEAMSKAHILLSDISGITHEFAFIYGRPVVIIDRKQAAGGLEGEVLGGDSELKEQCKDFIVPTDPGEIGRIADHLTKVLDQHSADRVREVRDRLIYNFGSGSQVAAQQLEDLYRTELARVAAEESVAGKSRGLLGRFLKPKHRLPSAS